MTEAQERKLREQVNRIEQKLDALAKAIGGPILRREFPRIEKNLSKSRQTFPR